MRLGDIDKHQGYEHDGLSKNDRHHIGCEKLEGNVLTSTAHLILSSFNSFSVLYGYLAYRLYQKYGECHDTNQGDDLDEELDESTTFGAGKCRSELFDESHGETRDDTNHNDDGNTVADSAVGDAFTEPQHEHRTGCENNGGGCHEPETITNEEGMRSLRLHFQVDEVGRGLESENGKRQVTGVLIDLARSAFAFTLQLLEIGNCNCQELNNNRSCDVGHNTQSKD